MRSHLGAFSGDLPEGESITKGFYINTIDLWVHSYYLDGLFSLFDSQYKVLLDVLGDLFDVILFCGVFAEIPMNCGFMIKIICEYYLVLL